MIYSPVKTVVACFKFRNKPGSTLSWRRSESSVRQRKAMIADSRPEGDGHHAWLKLLTSRRNTATDFN
jgi:hypothetical protein